MRFLIKLIINVCKISDLRCCFFKYKWSGISHVSQIITTAASFRPMSYVNQAPTKYYEMQTKKRVSVEFLFNNARFNLILCCKTVD